MTAEIGILNKRGIALAADSAVTIGNSKVLNNATKLFTLDSAHFIGMMIFGNANIMEIPWEVLIKIFREKNGNEVYDKTSEYKEQFIKFLESQKQLWDGSNRNDMLLNYIQDLFGAINKGWRDDLKDKSGEIDNEELFKKKIDEIDFSGSKKCFEIDKNNFERDTKKYIENIFEENLPFKSSNLDDLIERFRNKLFSFVESDIFTTSQTGVVIAGYGSQEFFPRLIELTIDGVYNGKIKFKENNNISTSVVDGESNAQLIPFAQQEMVHTVLSGIDPDLDSFRKLQLNSLQNSLVGALGDKFDKTLERLFENEDKLFDEYKLNNISGPIVRMIKNLSLNELGVMAETLVSLTSFKRRFSGDMQTVGGPIDVLVISRNEGPIWIKRKKYFDSDMNDGFKLRRK